MITALATVGAINIAVIAFLALRWWSKVRNEKDIDTRDTGAF